MARQGSGRGDRDRWIHWQAGIRKGRTNSPRPRTQPQATVAPLAPRISREWGRSGMQPAHAVVVNPPYQQPQVAQPVYPQQPVYVQQVAMQPQQVGYGQQPVFVQQVAMQPQGAGARAPPMRPSAWQFVFSGFGHFMCHPELWPYALIPMIAGTIIAIVALLVIFGTALAPQQELLSEARTPSPSFSAKRLCSPLHSLADPYNGYRRLASQIGSLGSLLSPSAWSKLRSSRSSCCRRCWVSSWKACS